MRASVVHSIVAGPSVRSAARVSPQFGTVRIPAQQYRSFQSTTLVLKKKKAVQDEDDLEFEAEQDTDDLFTATSIPTSSTSDAPDRSAVRAALKRTILDTSRLPAAEAKRAWSGLRVGTIRKVVQLSDTPEELEDLRGLIKVWRVMGGRITDQTAKEIVGRCCNLGRPDIAAELAKDKLQYGLPELNARGAEKLQAALANYQPPVPVADAAAQ